MKIRYCILPIVITIFLPSQGHAQWEQTNGPWTGDYTTAVCIHGSTLLAGTQHGVYRSTNGGGEWDETFSNTEMGTVTNIVSHGTTAFARGTSGGLLKSSDDGRQWLQVEVDTGLMVYRTIISSPDHSIILVGTRGGVYRSSNNGMSWLKSADTLVQGWVSTLVYNPSGNFVIARSLDSFIQSSDNGETWRKVGGRSDPPAEELLYNDTSLFVVGMKGVFRSFDNGETWTECNNGLPQSNGYTLYALNGIVYAGYPDGVYASYDNGESWNSLNAGFPVPMFRVFGLTASDDGSTLFAATDFGVWTTATDSIYWSPINEALPTLPFVSLTSHDAEVFAGSHGRGIYITSDDGETWQQFADSIIFSSPNYILSTGEILIVDFAWAGVRMWTLSSGTWNLDTVKLPNNYIRDAVAFRNGTGDHSICTVNEFSIWLSTNSGRTWTRSFQETSESHIYSIDVQQLSDGSTILYAGTLHNGMLISHDEGRTWANLTSFPESSVRSIVATESAVFASAGSGLQKSEDAGQSWEEVAVGSPGARVSKLWKYTDDQHQRTHLFAFVEYNGVYYGGIYYSGDGGIQWYLASSGLPQTLQGTISYSNGNIFVGTSYEGVWRRGIDEFGVLPVENTPTPATARLHQNYPNPVSSSNGGITQIDYEIDTPGHVSLSVCNVLGTVRVVLVEDILSSGKHTATWNTTGLPPGVYIYRLVAGNARLQKRLLVVN